MNETCSTNAPPRVVGLFISPGHNFFGHKDQAPGTHPIIPVDRVECVAGHGIRGDRFFDFKEDYKGQITFFSMEVFDAMLRELSLVEARPEGTRRNVFLRGANLHDWVGQRFEIQGVQFEGVEECRPCFWMNGVFRHPGAEEWLRGRGGLRARILTDGELRCQSA